MANDPISKWANEAQRRAESALPKNSINTPLIPHEVYDQMEQIEKDIKRLRDNNTRLKLDLVEARQQLYEIGKLIKNYKNKQDEHTTI